LIRALKKLGYDDLRVPREPKPPTSHTPNQIRVRIRIENQSDVAPWLVHSRVHEFVVDVAKTALAFRMKSQAMIEGNHGRT
jgi:hypothetical protein